MQQRRGQAAIEYLMNYSWAILILALVIAIILASGIFNPTYFVMEECYLGPSFSCHEQLIHRNTDTRLLFNITNRLGYPIKLNNITFYAENLGKSGMNAVSLDLADVYVENGGSNVSSIFFTGPSQPPKGTVKKIYINLTYYICAEEVNSQCKTDPPFLRTVSGRIVTRII